MKFKHLLAIVAIAAVASACHKDPGTDTPDNPASTFTKSSPWSVIGTIGGSSWNKDFEMKSNGAWHAAFDITVASGEEFKFRKNKNWDTNFGASSVKVGEKISLVPGGGNIKVPA